MKTITAVALFILIVWGASAQLPNNVVSTVNSGTVTWKWGDSWAAMDLRQRTYKAALTSNASGTAEAVLTGIHGHITRISYIPGTGGDQPTTLYDVAIVDGDSYQVDQTNGPNLSNTASVVTILTGAPVPVAGQMTVTGTNMGATNKAYIHIYTLLAEP